MQMIDPTKEGIKDFYDAYHEISSMVHDSKYSSTFRLNSGESHINRFKFESFTCAGTFCSVSMAKDICRMLILCTIML